MTEWKSLANAIIHDAYDPNLRVIMMCCENCQNPYLHLHMEESYPIRNINGRMTVYILQCPVCGHKELDIIGTYNILEYIPPILLPFMGHFLAFLSQMNVLVRDITVEQKDVSPDAK